MSFVAALCSPPSDDSPSPAATVIATIHQPSEAIFSLSADLVLLGKGGRVCYAGPTQEAMAFVLDACHGLPSLPSPAEARSVRLRGWRDGRMDICTLDETQTDCALFPSPNANHSSPTPPTSS